MNENENFFLGFSHLQTNNVQVSKATIHMEFVHRKTIKKPGWTNFSISLSSCSCINFCCLLLTIRHGHQHSSGIFLVDVSMCMRVLVFCSSDFCVVCLQTDYATLTKYFECVKKPNNCFLADNSNVHILCGLIYSLSFSDYMWFFIHELTINYITTKVDLLAITTLLLCFIAQFQFVLLRT